MWNLVGNLFGKAEKMSFELKQSGNISILSIKSDLTKHVMSELKEALTNATDDTNCKYLVVSFAYVSIATGEALSEISLAARPLKERGGKLYGVRLGEKIQVMIKVRGLDSAICIKPTEVEALAEVTPGAAKAKAPTAPKIDVNFVNPFVSATLETLKVQANVGSSAGKPHLKVQDSSLHWDITAIIGLSSKHFNGAIALCFPKEVFLAIMSNMLGEKYTEITQELGDGAGELLNIIFGQAKKVLNQNNYEIEKAIPTVVIGTDIKVKQLAESPTVVLPFTTDFGVYHVEVVTDASLVNNQASLAA